MFITAVCKQYERNNQLQEKWVLKTYISGRNQLKEVNQIK